MKHISLELQRLVERIAPGGCGCGTGGSHKSHGSGIVSETTYQKTQKAQASRLLYD
jgi:hypothetical protein